MGILEILIISFTLFCLFITAGVIKITYENHRADKELLNYIKEISYE